MSISSALKTFLAKRFWPWLKEFVWPILIKHILDIISVIFSKLSETIKKWFYKSADKRASNASKNAEEAEVRAKQAKTSEETEKYKIVAQVWREVAEQIRVENEALRQQLDDILTQAGAEAKSMVSDLDINIDFSSENPTLDVGSTSTELPKLSEELDR